MKKYFFVVLFGVFSCILFAQSEAVIPSLGYQQSPLLNGAGRIGVSLPTYDAIGFYYNPALLGYSSRENSLSFFVMPQNTKWLNNLYGLNITLRSVGVTAGYNFQKDGRGIPLSIGVGYIYNKFDYGNYSYYSSSIDNYDSFDCFSVGASYNYYLLFNLGFSIKSINSTIAYTTTYSPEPKSVTAKGTALDFGIMIIAPFADLFFNNAKIELSRDSFIKPKVDLSLGYSLTNLGKEISYIDPAQSDPIQRTARLGYTLGFGFDLFLQNIKMNAIGYSFTAEAEDILIKNRTINSDIEYQGLFGDIIFGKHLIGLNGDENVTVHKGHTFKFLDTYTFLSGRFNGHGFDNRKTNGYGLSSEGISKLLGALIDNPVIDFIADHIVIEYYDTNIFVDTGLDTNYKGFSFYLKRFEL